MAYLGKYYAFKIAGSAELVMYRATKDTSYQQRAVSLLTEALEFWNLYTDTALEQNINPIWTNRVGHVNWIENREWVLQDIETAKEKL